jgi:glutathione S-transferase
MAPSAKPYRMISARVSPMVELARWLMERYAIPYAEEAHAPMLHVLATQRAKGGVEVPVIVTPQGEVWKGARDTLKGVDALSPPGRKLFGESEAERSANQAFLEEILSRTLQTVRRFVYYQVIPNRRGLIPTVTHRSPLWEQLFVRLFYPVWRGMMARGLEFTPEKLAEAPVKIEEALSLVEAELKRRGTPFLGGEQPGSLDIVFSALAGPLVFPRNYGARLPAWEDLPPALQEFVRVTRARPAGDLVLRTYDVARWPKGSDGSV